MHVFTASGAVFGFLALSAAADANWTSCFAWLGVALLVDGLDGPMARQTRVKEVLPRFSGEDLDKIVDYLTYVTVPAFLIAHSSLAPEPLRLPLALAVMMVSLYHFADRESKTAEGYFVGFPAIWNVIVFYCFVLGLAPLFAAALIGLCLALTFVPFRWVHPLQVRRLRSLTIAVTAIWAAAALGALYQGFPAQIAVRVIFTGAAAYMLALGFSAGPRGADT